MNGIAICGSRQEAPSCACNVAYLLYPYLGLCLEHMGVQKKSEDIGIFFAFNLRNAHSTITLYQLNFTTAMCLGLSLIKRGVFSRQLIFNSVHRKVPHRASYLSCPCSCSVIPISLLPSVLLHHQNLHHPHKDVQEIQLKRDTLVHRILLDDAPFREPSVV